jgi:hypothetical protein
MNANEKLSHCHLLHRMELVRTPTLPKVWSFWPLRELLVARLVLFEALLVLFVFPTAFSCIGLQGQMSYDLQRLANDKKELLLFTLSYNSDCM